MSFFFLLQPAGRHLPLPTPPRLLDPRTLSRSLALKIFAVSSPEQNTVAPVSSCVNKKSSLQHFFQQQKSLCQKHFIFSQLSFFCQL
jgi:hypothetical protein